MSSNKPSTSIGWGVSGTEPDTRVKNRGLGGNDSLPKQWINWWYRTYSDWSAWWNERFTDGGSSADAVIQAPSDQGGSLSLLAGDAPNQSNTDGGRLNLRAGSSRGTGYSQILIKAATPGSTGTTERVPETYITVGGANGNTQLHKPLREASPITRYMRIPGAFGIGFYSNAIMYGAYDSGMLDMNGDDQYFYWPVVLPHGSTITAIKAWSNTSTATDSATLQLQKVAPASVPGAATTIASDTQTINTTPSYYHSVTGLSEVYSSSHIYWLVMTWPAPANTSRVGFLEITYTVDQLSIMRVC